jgi:hypothetical protein
MATDNELRWCRVAAQGKRVPAWARRSALAADGTVFVTGAVTGSEMDAFLSAGYDGLAIVRDGEHVYLPADWLRQEYPNSASLVTKIERATREHFA